jgi:hypothetical protein
MVRNPGQAAEEAVYVLKTEHWFPPPRPKMISLKGI